MATLFLLLGIYKFLFKMGTSNVNISVFNVFIRLNQELVYKLSSPVLHVLIPNNPLPEKWNLTSSRSLVDVRFQLPLYKSRVPTKWDVCCGIVSSFGQSWNLDMCRSVSLSPYVIRCSCNHSSMFAIFATESPTVSKSVLFSNFKYG